MNSTNKRQLKQDVTEETPRTLLRGLSRSLKENETAIDHAKISKGTSLQPKITSNFPNRAHVVPSRRSIFQPTPLNKDSHHTPLLPATKTTKLISRSSLGNASMKASSSRVKSRDTPRTNIRGLIRSVATPSTKTSEIDLSIRKSAEIGTIPEQEEQEQEKEQEEERNEEYDRNEEETEMNFEEGGFGMHHQIQRENDMDRKTLVNDSLPDYEQSDDESYTNEVVHDEDDLDHDAFSDEHLDETTSSFPMDTTTSSTYPPISRDSIDGLSFDMDVAAKLEEIHRLSELDMKKRKKGQQALSTDQSGISGETRGDRTRRVAGSLPKSLVTQLFTSLSRKRPTKDAIELVNELSEKYLQQVSEDLAAYAFHAKRKTIETEDVLCLFRRQKLIDSQHALEDMIRRHLPLENVEDLLPIARAHNVVVPGHK